jgi:hypothetical protein
MVSGIDWNFFPLFLRESLLTISIYTRNTSCPRPLDAAFYSEYWVRLQSCPTVSSHLQRDLLINHHDDESQMVVRKDHDALAPYLSRLYSSDEGLTALAFLSTLPIITLLRPVHNRCVHRANTTHFHISPHL